LITFVHYEGEIGDHARRALLCCLEITTPVVEEFILQQSGFCPVTVAALTGWFSTLSGQHSSEATGKFITLLEFFQKAVKIDKPRISNELKEGFKKQFLQQVVLPKLATDDIDDLELEATTVHVSEMLQIINDENMSRGFVDLLLSDTPMVFPGQIGGESLRDESTESVKAVQVPYLIQFEAEAHEDPNGNVLAMLDPYSKLNQKKTNEDGEAEAEKESPANLSGQANLASKKRKISRVRSQGKSLKQILFFRLNDHSEGVQIATWQLFFTLTTKHQRYSFRHLFKSTLAMLASLDPVAINHEKHEEEMKRFLELFPATTHNEIELFGYENYLLDIQEIITASKESGKMASLIICQRIQVYTIMGLAPEAFTIEEIKGQGEKSDEETRENNEPDIFLQIILGRLHTFMINSFDTNLMITGIITQLACYADERFTDFVLHSDLLDKRYLLSLHAILLEISREIVNELNASPYHRKNLDLVRDCLDPFTKNSSKGLASLEKDDLNFFRNVVIFEEFIKELIAVLQARLLNGTSELNYME